MCNQDDRGQFKRVTFGFSLLWVSSSPNHRSNCVTCDLSSSVSHYMFKGGTEYFLSQLCLFRQTRKVQMNIYFLVIFGLNSFFLAKILFNC